MPNPHEDSYRLGLGRALFAQGRYKEAVEQLCHVTGESKELADRDWRTELVFSLLPYVNHREAYGMLKSWLEGQQQTAAAGGRSRAEADAQAAGLWLVRDCYWSLHRAPAGTPALLEVAGVAPLTFLVDPHFLPEQVADSDVSRISERVHRLQRRIKHDTGLLVPTPFIRGDPRLSAGAYEVLVYEVRATLGREAGPIPPDMRYCADGDRCRRVGLHGTPDGAGVWLPEKAWQRASKEGLRLEEPEDVLLGRLERVVRRHLPSFIGMQEVQALIDDWDREHDDPLSRKLTVGGVPVKLVKVIRSLASERVSVADLNVVCQTFADAGDDTPVLEIVDRIRLRLAPTLPGGQQTVWILGLSPMFEADLSARLAVPTEGQPLLAMTRDEAAAVIGAVRDHAGDGHSRDEVVVVVRERGLRGYVRRLLVTELPDVPVLSTEELARRPGGLAVREEIASPISAGKR